MQDNNPMPEALKFLLSFCAGVACIVLFQNGCNSPTKPAKTSVETTTTVEHSQSVKFDTVAFLKTIKPVIVDRWHNVKSEYSPLPKDTAKGGKTASICDTIKTYNDTLIQPDIKLFSEIKVRGKLLSHKMSGSVVEKEITKTVTDSTTIKKDTKETITVEEKYPFFKKAKLAVGGFFVGVVATTSAAIYYYVKGK